MPRPKHVKEESPIIVALTKTHFTEEDYKKLRMISVVKNISVSEIVSTLIVQYIKAEFPRSIKALDSK